MREIKQYLYSGSKILVWLSILFQFGFLAVIMTGFDIYGIIGFAIISIYGIFRTKNKFLLSNEFEDSIPLFIILFIALFNIGLRFLLLIAIPFIVFDYLISSKRKNQLDWKTADVSSL